MDTPTNSHTYKKNWKRSGCLLFILISTALLFSCKDNTTGANPGTTAEISGTAIDPEIANAEVEIIKNDDSGETLETVNIVKTGSNGKFTVKIKIPLGEDLTNYIIKIKGGFDTCTGVDFDGQELKALIEEHHKKGSNANVTPITTLVSEDVLENKGTNRGRAWQRISEMLNISTNELADSPLSNAKLLRTGMIMSYIIKNLDLTKEQKKLAFRKLKAALHKHKDKIRTRGGLAETMTNDTDGNSLLDEIGSEFGKQVASEKRTGLRDLAGSLASNRDRSPGDIQQAGASQIMRHAFIDIIQTDYSINLRALLNTSAATNGFNVMTDALTRIITKLNSRDASKQIVKILIKKIIGDSTGQTAAAALKAKIEELGGEAEGSRTKLRALLESIKTSMQAYASLNDQLPQ